MRQACQLSRDDSFDIEVVSNMETEAKDVSRMEQAFKDCRIELLN
jgi:hypothetical protein